MRVESDRTNLGLIGEEDGEEEGVVEASVHGSDDLRSVPEMQEDQNICKFPESSVNASVSRRKVSKSVNKGFNLRKSLAWNPAFFTEEGVLEPAELSYITRSNGFQKAGERSVLNEVLNNSCEKKSNQNSKLKFQNGRKLFCTPESSKLGARSVNSRLPRPPITNSQKRVANTNATGHIPKAPKFMAGNGNITPNSKISNISKITPTIKKEQSNFKKTSLLPPKSSNKIISKTVLKPPVQQPSALNAEKNDNNNNCNNNENVGPTARILMKPSALKTPSPSFGFFSQGKVSPQPSNYSQNDIDNKTLNSSSKPPNPNSTKLPTIPPPVAARCQTPIGRIITSKLNTPSTSSKIQTGQKNVIQMGKFDRVGNSSGKREKEERSIRVLKSKVEKSGNGKIRVCERAKEEMCFDGETRVCEVAKEGTCFDSKIRVCEEVREGTCFDGTIRVCEEAREETCSNGKIRVCEEAREETCSNGKIRVCEEAIEETCSNGKIWVCDEETCSNGKIRVREVAKEEMCTIDKDRVCEESKQGSTSKTRVCEESTDKENYSVETQHKNDSIQSETLTRSKSTLTESKSNRTENKEEKFTNQIPSEIPSLIEKQKSKRKSSIYGLSPLRNNKRDKTVFSPHKRKEIEAEKSKSKPKEDLKPDLTMSIEEKKKADCLTKCRKDLVPFSDEWFAALETFGEEILEKKTGPVQHSPPDKTAPEPSPWSPVKRKVQELGPYDCTKYSKTVPSDAEK